MLRVALSSFAVAVADVDVVFDAASAGGRSIGYLSMCPVVVVVYNLECVAP